MHDNHIHDHSGQKHSSPAETLALLTYMSDHNKHHSEDLHEVFHALEHAGEAAAAQALHKALHLYGEANALLDEALALLKSHSAIE